jgi:histidinol-phosphate aminotransferase
VARCIETNAVERTRLSAGLTKMGLRPVASEANFVFLQVGPDAKEISDELLPKGVIVRPLAWMGFPEAIRISVGTTEENDKFLRALAEVLPKRAGKGELAAR